MLTLQAIAEHRREAVGTTITPFVARRATLVPQMVTALASHDVRCQEDAMKALLSEGFRVTDVIMLIDDVRQVAFQQSIDVVAREMSAQ